MHVAGRRGELQQWLRTSSQSATLLCSVAAAARLGFWRGEANSNFFPDPLCCVLQVSRELQPLSVSRSGNPYQALSPSYPAIPNGPCCMQALRVRLCVHSAYAQAGVVSEPATTTGSSNTICANSNPTHTPLVFAPPQGYHTINDSAQLYREMPLAPAADTASRWVQMAVRSRS